MTRWKRPLEDAFTTTRVLVETGLVSPVWPDRLLGMGLALAQWGVSPAAGYAAAAARDPRRPILIDERDVLTAEEVDRRTNAIARGLAALGVSQGDSVALLARNSAQFVLAQVAVSKAGADLLYLNTGFGGPQIADVLTSEGASLVIADEEFGPLMDEVGVAVPRVTAWHDGGKGDGTLTLDDLARGDDSPPSPVRRAQRHIILTSGTTGRPKGAARSAPGLAGLEPLVALLGRIPLRARETTVIAAPMFHAWGFSHLTIAMLLQSTIVLSRRFTPERTLALIEEHQAHGLVAVPVMLQRILDLPDDVRARHDTSSLRVIALSGSALARDLPARTEREFGPVLHSLYGSTEVAYASVAGPDDLRDDPATAGHPLRGVAIRIVDEHGNDVPEGETGRIFVGNVLTFEGYTGGEDKDRLGALAATGDVGRIDAKGRLHVEGRADDMIVSGGENVFPVEVEECLLSHPGVADAAVVGVQDERFGQALVAHVVRRDGAQVDAVALREHVKRSLANYKVPREVVFHDALPRNETGKVLKRKLASA
jgi:fatty-acyl-CoA synthase